VTGVEVVIENCLPEVHKILPDFRTWEEKIPIMVDDAIAICLVIPQRMRLSGTVTQTWRLKDNGVTTLIFWGHVTSSVTWPFDSRRSTSYGWSIATMRLSSTAMEIWPFEVWTSSRKALQGTKVGRRSVLNITLISYTPLRYVRNVTREK